MSTQAVALSKAKGRKQSIEDRIPSEPEQMFPLMKLPAEILIIICKFATYSSSTIKIRHVERRIRNPLKTRHGKTYNRFTCTPSSPFESHTLLAIANTNSLLYHTATPFYYSKNKFIFCERRSFDDFLTAVGPAIACLIVDIHLRYSSNYIGQRLDFVPRLEMKTLKVLRVDLEVPWRLAGQPIPADNMFLSMTPDLVKLTKSLERLELRVNLHRSPSWRMLSNLSEETFLRCAQVMAELFGRQLQILGSDVKVLVAEDT